MNTSSDDAASLARRKTRHLEICLTPDRYDVEGSGAGFEGLRFAHRALPELDAERLDTGREFLGRRLRLPFFISSMTGGSEAGYRINKDLARAAQSLGIPVGLGSHRILLRKPEVFDHFHLRALAPDVPILSNLGAVQIRETGQEAVFELNRRLEVDAQIIHLNAGQELFQPGGDRDFTALKDTLARFIEKSPLPVIVKETGFGIAPDEIRFLTDAGAAYIDLAGAGGTNWLTVEAYREDPEVQAAAEDFRDWGYPTAVLLAALGPHRGRLLASGGIRTGLDVSKCLALGASLAGLALPFARAVAEAGVEGAVALGKRLELGLRTVMVLTGSRSLAELERARLFRSESFAYAVNELERTFYPHSPLEDRTPGHL